jgi:sec-independent protein translocase protein TatA
MDRIRDDRTTDSRADLARSLAMPLAFGMPGMQELMIIGFIALLIFGNRLPSVMRSLGKSVTEFKKGVAGIEDDLDTAATADKKPPVEHP